MKRIIKNPLLTFILGAVIFGGIGTVLAATLLANNISYIPSDNTWKKINGEDITNVQDAIDELYNKTNTYIKLDKVTTANSNDILSGKTAYDNNGQLITGNYIHNFEVENNYFASYYGTESKTKTITKVVPKGNYIVSCQDSIGTRYSSGNYSKESDYITFTCNNNCIIEKIDEHNILASGDGYANTCHAIYKVIVTTDNTTLTQKTAMSENHSINRQTMSMQIVKLK